MLKQSGRYDEALEVFKTAKKKYRKDPRGYLYRKSRVEMQSCVWAKSNQGDSTHHVFEALPDHINTANARSEEHTSELQSRPHLVCRLLLEKKKKTKTYK